MPEVQPPGYVQAGEYGAADDRRAITAGVRAPGILRTGDLGVFPTDTASMAVTVGSGAAWVQGDQTVDQGYYYVYNDGDVTLPIADADGTNDRIDIVVARVYDEEYGDDASRWDLEVVQGAPSSSPADPALPPNSYALARVTVRAGATSIGSGDIFHLRNFASHLSDRYTVVHGHRGTGVVGSPPNTTYDFILITGSELVTTDGNGQARIYYPDPPNDIQTMEGGRETNFPNGVMTVVATPGYASPPFFVNVNHGGHTVDSFLVRCFSPDGTRLANEEIRINYIAVGW